MEWWKTKSWAFDFGIDGLFIFTIVRKTHREVERGMSIVRVLECGIVIDMNLMITLSELYMRILTMRFALLLQ